MVRQQPEIAGQPAAQVVGGQPACAGGLGPLGVGLGHRQPLRHRPDPALARLGGQRVELAQVVGVAQRMRGAGIVPVGRPAVVEGDPIHMAQLNISKSQIKNRKNAVARRATRKNARCAGKERTQQVPNPT